MAHPGYPRGMGTRCPLPLLVALALALPCPAAAAHETALLHLRVNRPDGCGVELEKRDVRLGVSVHGEDSLGWPASFRPNREQEPRLGPLWQCYEVPKGAEVRISVLASPHPLLERIFRMDEDAEEKRLHLVLEDPVPAMSIGVDVALPEGLPSYADISSVTVSAPRTGHVLEFSDMMEAKAGLRLPRGTYEVSVHGKLTGGCANGAPRREWMVPARARVEARDGARVLLRPVIGTRLGLRVVHPDPTASKAGMEALEDADAPGDLVIGQRYAGGKEDLVRARLVSTDGKEVHDLTWGWEGLHYVWPRDRFPMGEDVYQIVPLPRGEYELILRGTGIEELRRTVTLGPDEELALELRPKAASKKR